MEKQGETDLVFNDLKTAVQVLENNGFKVELTDGQLLVFPEKLPANYPEAPNEAQNRLAVAEIIGNGRIKLCNEHEPLIESYHAALERLIKGSREGIDETLSYPSDPDPELSPEEFHELVAFCQEYGLISVLEFASQRGEFHSVDLLAHGSHILRAFPKVKMAEEKGLLLMRFGKLEGRRRQFRVFRLSILGRKVLQYVNRDSGGGKEEEQAWYNRFFGRVLSPKA
jgi:hypothetical protein